MTGHICGRLTVFERAGRNQDKRVTWRCLCSCGNECVITGKYLRSGLTKSCGCLQKERTSKRSTTHGMSRSKTYVSWSGMLNRCYNEKQKSYRRYGALGITVCDRWRKSFSNFLDDMGIRPEGMTLDRKNPCRSYELDNCRWSTPKQQALNTRGHAALRFIERMGLTKTFEEGNTRI